MQKVKTTNYDKIMLQNRIESFYKNKTGRNNIFVDADFGEPKFGVEGPFFSNEWATEALEMDANGKSQNGLPFTLAPDVRDKFRRQLQTGGRRRRRGTKRRRVSSKKKRSTRKRR